jgi:hypothetical protein
MIASFPLLILAIAFLFIQKKRLKYYELIVNYTNEQFKEVVKRTSNDLNWRIEKNNKHFFRAYRPSNWTGSWGEMITIIKDENKLYLNSICDPNKHTSIISYGWNKRNLKTFIIHLKEVLKEFPENNENGTENLESELINRNSYED